MKNILLVLMLIAALSGTSQNLGRHMDSFSMAYYTADTSSSNEMYLYHYDYDDNFTLIFFDSLNVAVNVQYVYANKSDAKKHLSDLICNYHKENGKYKKTSLYLSNDGTKYACLYKSDKDYIVSIFTNDD